MVRAFSNGSEFADFMSDNCYQCRKYKENPNVSCKYEQSISMAYCGDGQITQKQYDILGIDSGVCTIRIHKLTPTKQRTRRIKTKGMVSLWSVQ